MTHNCLAILSFCCSLIVFISCTSEPPCKTQEITCFIKGKYGYIAQDSIQVKVGSKLITGDQRYFEIYREDTIYFPYYKMKENVSNSMLTPNVKRDSLTLFVQNEEIKIFKVNTYNSYIVDNKASFYYTNGGRPLIKSWDSWAKYYTYPTNQLDQILIKRLEEDTTCFFKCKKRVPTPPSLQ